MNVDVHGHVVVPEILRSASHPETWRPEITRQPNGWQMVGNDRFLNGPIPKEIMDWPEIIQNLDATKVDLMAVSPAPFLMFYYLDGATGYDACQIQNDAIAQAVARYPDRLVGMGIVPLQDTKLAVKELERLAGELGMPGIEIRSNMNGMYLGDKSLWPFWEAVEALDLFVFVHPDQPIIGEDKLSEYYLGNLVGNPIETTRSIADVVFSGLLAAYPKLKICFAHAGGTVPYIRGRFEHGYHVRTEPKAKIDRPPSEYIKLLYFDTITHWEPALEFLVNTVGADHVVVGSDYPFDMGPAEPVRFVEGVPGISAGDKKKILSENAIRLLKLDV
jgi:aminocarboxymuconate-semialdehyde decarboxylase